MNHIQTDNEFYEYTKWINANDLPVDLSAEELLCEVDDDDEYITTPEQRQWLKSFIEKYDN